MKIFKTQLPHPSSVRSSFPFTDYSDAYGCTFVCEKELTVDDFVYAFFDSSPKWIGHLLGLRNKIVKFLGLKTGGNIDPLQARKDFRIEKGHSLGLFKITARQEHEVLMGEDDEHLNFRVSFFLKKEQKEYQFILSTVVQINNRLGSLYFFFVKPFHKFIVPAMMRSMVKSVI